MTAGIDVTAMSARCYWVEITIVVVVKRLLFIAFYHALAKSRVEGTAANLE